MFFSRFIQVLLCTSVLLVVSEVLLRTFGAHVAMASRFGTSAAYFRCRGAFHLLFSPMVPNFSLCRNIGRARATFARVKLHSSNITRMTSLSLILLIMVGNTKSRHLFLPKEIWGWHGFEEMGMYKLGNEERAQWVLTR